MAGKIFYRGRRRVEDGAKQPRFRIVAVAEIDLKIYTDHLRMSELEHIAESLDAELIHLKRGSKHLTEV